MEGRDAWGKKEQEIKIVSSVFHSLVEPAHCDNLFLELDEAWDIGAPSRIHFLPILFLTVFSVSEKITYVVF